MSRLKRKIRKMSLYKKSLIIFTIFLVILGNIFLIYVSNCLKAYELGNVDNYMNKLVNDMKTAAKKGNIDKYISYGKIDSEYEKKSSFADGYKELFKNSKLTFAKSKTVNEKNVYDIFADEQNIASVYLDGSKSVTKLTLLSFTKWDISKVEANNKEGIYNLDIYINDNYKLFINDKEALQSDLVESSMIEEYEEVYDKVSLPKLNHYNIKNLTHKPNIVVKDENNKEVDYEIKDGKYYANDYYHVDDYEVAKEKLVDKTFDPLEFAKNWSLFLTDDLPGATHGLYTLTPHLIQGTALYKRAYDWATLVDITFTSIHRLDKETFTNVKVSNVTVYNENAFSVEIYLEKNMTLSDMQRRTDILHDTFYYVYHDGAFKLVSMIAMKEN